ncbi:MAG: hypothetical protein H3C34_26960 [Caldilineaceae bacterium]|nr:hypothetical protein [Caldilineaceae bacterium]
MTVPKRFDILRFMSALLKVFAWICLVLSILMAIGVVLFGAQASQFLGDASGAAGLLIGGGGGIVAGLFILLAGLIYFIILYASGEMISLQLAVEENTRLTAALLLRMHQDSQVDTRSSSYPGGFTSEPEPYQ